MFKYISIYPTSNSSVVHLWPLSYLTEPENIFEYINDLILAWEPSSISTELSWKDGISIGFINNTDQSISDAINQIFVKLQAINANVSDLYVEDNDFGKSLLDEYQKSSYSFADNISIVSEKKELIEDVQNENISNLSSDEQQ